MEEPHIGYYRKSMTPLFLKTTMMVDSCMLFSVLEHILVHLSGARGASIATYYYVRPCTPRRVRPTLSSRVRSTTHLFLGGLRGPRGSLSFSGLKKQRSRRSLTPPCPVPSPPPPPPTTTSFHPVYAADLSNRTAVVWWWLKMISRWPRPRRNSSRFVRAKQPWRIVFFFSFSFSLFYAY